MKSLNLTSAILLLFITLAAAWPWPHALEVAREASLLPRQQSQSQSQSQSQTSSPSQTPSSSQTNSNSKSNSGSNTASGSSSITGSGGSSTAKITGSGASNSTAFTKTTAIDPRLPPGGVSIITPAATETTYVKVGDQVTFQWNYTSLSVPPSYIDVIATNTINSQTYTIAANQSYEPTATVVWDTNEFTQTTDLPFVVATYTLMIYDANSNPTAVASAGYLGAFANLQFGIYTPQPYTPLNEFRCVTCNGAMSLHEKQAFGVLLGTCLVTVFSFTWFATGFGVF